MRVTMLCLVIGAFIQFAFIAPSTKSPKSKKKRLIELADSTFFHENFEDALVIYDQIISDYAENHYIQYHRDVAYHLSKGRGTDVSKIYNFEENGGRVDKFYNYWLGRIHFDRYEFDASKRHFEMFLEMKVYKSKEIKAETQQYLQRIKKAKDYYDHPDDYQIVSLAAPINSKHADLSPAFFGNHNELLFVSERGNQRNGVYEVYHTVKENNGWTEPTVLKELGKLIKGKAKIEVVNQDGKLFVNGRNGAPGLFFSEPTADSWTEPQGFDSKIDDKALQASFFINDDENAIYFASKSNGTKLNLYESHLDESANNWSSPELLKGDINSKYDDDNPFLSHDGRYLYFSSNRKGSIGGYDVFRSEFDPETKTWSQGMNLGFPINTIDDEVNFQLNEDNVSGFLSSNRLHGLGDFDIYYFHRPGKIMAFGQVIDRKTKQPVKETVVEFHPVKYTDEYFRTVTDSEGRFKLQVFENEEFIIQLSYDEQLILANKVLCKAGDLHKSYKIDFQIDVPETHLVKNDIHSPTGAIEDESSYAELNMLGNKFRSGQKAILRNIYFDFHSYHLQDGYMDVLNQISGVLKASPDLEIEISGHTDNIGTEKTNAYISLKRAKSIKEYLVKMGISPDRLVTIGNGANNPLASNDDEVGGRELNRRIEVRVMD